MADAGSGTAPDEEADDPRAARPAPKGWRRFEGPGEQGPPDDVFLLDPDRLDYPEKWRQESEARERALLDRCGEAQDVIAELRAQWAGIDFSKLSQNAIEASEIAEFTGNRLAAEQVSMLRQSFYTRIRQAAERIAPLAGVTPLGAMIYLAERTLPVEFFLSVIDEPYKPVQIAVNAQPGKVLHVTLAPGEAMLRFGRIARRDLNRVGHFVTEALEILDPEQRRNRGGRRSLDDDDGPLATPELAARLYYWEGWSQRHIAAFFGWIRPDEDWSDPKVKKRIEMRVGRYVQRGKASLRDEAGDSTDDNDSAWRRPPAQLERAAHADERRPRRR